MLLPIFLLSFILSSLTNAGADAKFSTKLDLENLVEKLEFRLEEMERRMQDGEEKQAREKKELEARNKELETRLEDKMRKEVEESSRPSCRSDIGVAGWNTQFSPNCDL